MSSIAGDSVHYAMGWWLRLGAAGHPQGLVNSLGPGPEVPDAARV